MCFGIACVAAVAVSFYAARHEWFLSDEYDFLANRSAFDLHDLFRDHAGHWSTIPILVYRALWRAFGLRHYTPYLVPVVFAHVAAAVLLRVIMRSAGVDAWIATAAAALFALFGTAWDDMAWAFQIGFVGSLTFGLAHMLLADHDGRVDRRDWFGLGAGLCALMCSSVGVTMVVVVGIAALLRRGWRIALLHTAPLGAAFVVWYFTIDPYRAPSPSLGDLADFVSVNFRSTFRNLGQVAGIGLVLFVVLVAGCIVGRSKITRSLMRTRWATPIAMLLGAGVFTVTTGVGRASIHTWPYLTYVNSHYMDVTAALLLPSIAIAGDLLARRWRWMLPVVVAIFLIGIPGNLRSLTRTMNQRAVTSASVKGRLLTVPELDVSRQVPRSAQPEPVFAPGATVGWLLDAARDGRLASTPGVSADAKASVELHLSLEGLRELPNGFSTCHVIRGQVERTLRKGDWVGVRGDARVYIGHRLAGGIALDTLGPRPSSRAVRARVDEITVQLAPVGRTAQLCESIGAT